MFDAENIVRRIRIAAALIDDNDGRILLVRKAGTQWFMQAGGKIENGESALAALRRELREEIGLELDGHRVQHLGKFLAVAANEPDSEVEAEIFHVRTPHIPRVSAEIEEAVWVLPEQATQMSLAPLTRDHVLPLARLV